MNIVLDFGHGGLNSKGEYTTAPGKMYKFANGEVAYEGMLNRQIGGKIEDYLKECSGYNIICTVDRNDPTDLSLAKRVEIANRLPKESTIFISIHCNAGKGSGFEIFTTKGTTKSDILAEYIADNVESLYKSHKLPLRYDLSDKDKDKESDFYVIKNTKGPAVLIECGFFDTEKDFQILKDPKFQKDLADRVAQGIINYIENEHKK